MFIFLTFKVIDTCVGLCENGGICLSNGNESYCQCFAGFTGKNCEIHISQCSSSPCMNDGICISNGNTFSCLCLPSFTGLFCQYDASTEVVFFLNFENMYDYEIIIFFYQNGTSVSPFPNTTSSYIDPCISLPCLNNGICIPSGNTFSCLCLPSYTGFACEITISV